jgi:O-antigen/teichoic acid export membrane protein
MDGTSHRKRWFESAKSWIVRFIKFNVIGTVVFLVGTAIYAAAFPTFGAWTWLIASAGGGFLQFILISYFNKKKKGMIFQQCESNKV